MRSNDPHTVLVVEDEELVRDLIARELEDAGYQVIEASAAEAALDLIRTRSASVLFTDIRLAGVMDGWQLAEQVRALQPDIPVIYTTGYSVETPRLVAGGIFLRKPYLPSAVLTAIARLTARD